MPRCRASATTGCEALERAVDRRADVCLGECLGRRGEQGDGVSPRLQRALEAPFVRDENRVARAVERAEFRS